MKLLNIRNIDGVIRLRTGLHIGAGKDSVEIGGLELPIVKDPVTKAPYIPGSSLKGKLRSLLETSVFMQYPQTQKSVVDGTPCTCGSEDCPDCTIFGTHQITQKNTSNPGPTRLLVRDAYLTEEFREKFVNGLLPMEVKMENTIHRVKGVADKPRPIERVPAGTCFEMHLAFRVYEGDSEDLIDWIWKGLRLIELDALGGGGSRGNGQVVFEDLKVDGKETSLESVKVF